VYFALLFVVALRTSRGANNQAFFVGNRSSAWPLVAFGMIGTSLSGVTFISVPGAVGSNGFSYWQIMLGHLVGYAVVAWVLLPLYYRLGMVSIYGWIEDRLGPSALRMAAGFFILSRTLGATARLYLVVRILQDVILERLGVPFAATAAVMVGMILLYTWRGGVKTIVWTDTLQTAGMLFGLGACIAFILQALDLSVFQALAQMEERGLSRVWGTEPAAKEYWLKQILAGAAIAIAMTGMDQEMMQKNLSVRTLRGAQLNMLSMAAAMSAVVLAFLFLGGLLMLFAQQAGMPERGDQLFPAVVMGHMPAVVQLIFILALISALFPSADGALTALTSSTCNDLLRFERQSRWSAPDQERIRKRVHLAYAAVFLLLVLGFRWLDDPSMIGLILKVASYTYGPLLGLFAFGWWTRRIVNDAKVVPVTLFAPVACGVLDAMQPLLFDSWRIGLELLLINGALVFIGLWLISRSAPASASPSSAEPGTA
jgi:Na+/proline symporter